MCPVSSFFCASQSPPHSPSESVTPNQGLLLFHAWLAHEGQIQVAGLCVPLSFETPTAGDRAAKQRRRVDAFPPSSLL